MSSVAAAQKSSAARVPPFLFALALGVAAWIVLDSFATAPHDARGDGRFYLFYMQSVHDGGLSVFPSLFEHWNGDPQSWIFPPPSRVGFIVVSALWAGMFGTTLVALQYLSIAAHFSSSIANYLFARRHFGEPRALFIGALWTFSPLLLGISRLALTDSLIALCMSVTAWLFFELVENPASRRARIAFMATFAFTVLVKELAVLLVVPFAAFVLIEKYWRREPIDLAKIALAFIVPGLVTLPIFVLAAGGFPTLFETTRIVLSSPATNPYAVKFGSGPWFRYVLDFLCLSPWTTLLATAYFGLWATRLRRGEYDRRLVYLALLVIALVFEYSFFTKNVRYAVLLELPLRVFAVLMLHEIFKSASQRKTSILCGIAVASLCFIDARAFDLYWVRDRGYDPVTYLLLGSRQMIPYAPK